MTEAASTLTVQALGGTTFAGVMNGETLGRFEAGSIDSDGQWVEGDEDLEDAAREAFELGDEISIELPF